jgi:hypothetical protein
MKSCKSSEKPLEEFLKQKVNLFFIFSIFLLIFYGPENALAQLRSGLSPPFVEKKTMDPDPGTLVQSPLNYIYSDYSPLLFLAFSKYFTSIP